MRQARLLIPLLIAATVLVDLVTLSVLASFADMPPEWPHPGILVLFSLAMSQSSLVALWAGFGGKSLPWRMLGLFLTIVLWGRLVGWTIEPADPERYATTMWTFLLLAQAIAILVPLSIARLRGTKLVEASHVDSAHQSVSDRPLMQFSLGYLLSWITVVAVVLGLFQYSVDYRFLPWVWGLWWEIFVPSVKHALLALVALWVALGKQRPALPVLLLLALSTAALIVADPFANADDLLPYAAVCLLQLLWLVASLWVVRVAGYRVAGRARVVSEERPSLKEES